MSYMDDPNYDLRDWNSETPLGETLNKTPEILHDTADALTIEVHQLALPCQTNLPKRKGEAAPIFSSTFFSSPSVKQKQTTGLPESNDVGVLFRATRTRAETFTSLSRRELYNFIMNVKVLKDRAGRSSCPLKCGRRWKEREQDVKRHAFGGGCKTNPYNERIRCPNHGCNKKIRTRQDSVSRHLCEVHSYDHGRQANPMAEVAFNREWARG